MITDREARKISCQWHGGQGSALYALCPTGAIDTASPMHLSRPLWREIVNELSRENARPTVPRESLNELKALPEYVNHHKERGPVAGWGELTW